MIKPASRILSMVIVLSFFIMASGPALGHGAGQTDGTLNQAGPAGEIRQLNNRIAQAQGVEKIALIIRRGEAYREAGHYDVALSDFRTALDQSKSANDPALTAIATQNLGYVQYLRQEHDLSESLLRSALETAESLNQSALAASAANRLAIVLSGQGRREEAYPLYRQGLNWAQKAEDPALTAAIHRNLARLLDDSDRAIAELTAAREAATTVDAKEERTDLLLGIGAEASQERFGDSGMAIAYDVLTQALQLSSDLGDPRRVSQAAGRLAALYERRDRIDEALGLTEQALEAAQRLRADDLLMLWDWQLGRLLRAQGDRERAIAAYRRAVYHIEAIRQDIPVTYQGGKSSFRETLAPIYMGLTDLLLTQSEAVSEGEPRQALLREAQGTVERLKRSELTDYFRDPCVAALSRGVETLSPGTAVIYPIIMADRLELLVNVADRLERRSAPVNRETLESAVWDLVRRLRNEDDYEALSKRLHSWLIQPLIPVLEANETQTLVYVPDGVLRMLPIACLWDGRRFLVEQYAAVTAPGLTLLDPAPLAGREMDALMAGMSVPGPVLSDLPGPFLAALRGIGQTEMRRGVRGLTVTPEQLAESDGRTDQKDPPPEDIESIRHKLMLPGATAEIRRLSEKLPGKVLLNENFSLERFSSDLTGDPAYRVIHIASHGYFGGSPEQNFIMTYDRRLDMDRLATLIRPKQLAARPVELITLSACQTAQGDDRSPLGLSGVVLKSGARSAIGTLWPVSDSAAQDLLPRFYANLDDNATKAEALRKAQMALMAEADYRHPFYWGPFILVGNWL